MGTTLPQWWGFQLGVLISECRKEELVGATLLSSIRPNETSYLLRQGMDLKLSYEVNITLLCKIATPLVSAWR